MKRVILVVLFIIVIATCAVEHWGGNDNVSEKQTVRKNESVSAVINRPAGKTIVAPRGHDGHTGEDGISKHEAREQHRNESGYSENSSNDGNPAQINNKSTIQEESAESNPCLSADGDTGGTEDTKSVPELVESGTSDETGHEGPMDEYSGDTEDGHSDGHTDESEVGSGLIYLGNWFITFYCPCEICCGQWATGCTASGVPATEWHTIATDQFDFGTKIYIDGLGYFVVEDRGVTGEAIDVFVNDHQYALNLGEQHRDVYLVQGEEETP